LALIIGAPTIKPGWHILLMGGQGIGKELMIRPITTYLGPNRSTVVSADEIGGTFTGWICNRLVLMTEMRQTSRGTLTGHDKYGALKTILDNSRTYLPVNPKYGRPFQAKNVVAAWATSNEEQPLNLEKDDRRFWVHSSQSAAWTPEAYARLVRWMETPAWVDGPTGIERVCEHLLRRWETLPETRKAVLTGRAPMTQAKADLIALNDSPWEDYLQDILQDAGTLGDPKQSLSLRPLNELVTTLEVSHRMLNAQRSGEAGLPPHLRLPSQKTIGQMLRRLGAMRAAKGDQVRIPGGERSRVWDVTPGRIWRTALPDEIAGAIVAMRKAAIDNKLLGEFGSE
jgi:hypothetical protein